MQNAKDVVKPLNQNKMKEEQIKQSVLSGRNVYWKSDIYEVIVDNIGQWMVRCSVNGHCVGLLVTDEDDYYEKNI